MAGAREAGAAATVQASTSRRPRLRSSVLLKSVVAVAVALVASTGVASVVSAGLTRSALDSQSRQLARGKLSILQEAFAERKRTLDLNLSNLAQILETRGLFADRNRLELIAELGRASANLELDLVSVLIERGHELVPVAEVGEVLANPDIVLADPSGGTTSRLLETKSATFVQATTVPVVFGDTALFLVGGYAFTDRFAFVLRRQIGSFDDVLLVASGQVAGTTLATRPKRPPARSGAGLSPTPARIDSPDFKGVVAYVPVGPTTDREPGAIGLVLTDAVGPLEGALARARLAATAVIALVTLGLAWLLFRFFIRPLVKLAGTAGKIAAGDLDARFDAPTADEIGMLAGSLERMRIELRAKLDLIATQADDLQRQATELQETSQRISAAEDNGRRRLARDLHDGIQQQLVVMRMRVGMAADRAQGAEPAVVEDFEQIGLELDATIERLREVTRNLYPSILLDRGLAVAARSYLRQLPLHVHLDCAPDPFPRLAPEIESGAYFLLCEALTNSFKHSFSTNISVALHLDRDWLSVSVTDDGKGFAPDQVRGQGGLLHMHDRVRSFAGELVITSAPGRGARIVARFPSPPEPAPVGASEVPESS